MVEKNHPPVRIRRYFHWNSEAIFVTSVSFSIIIIIFLYLWFRHYPLESIRWFIFSMFCLPSLWYLLQWPIFLQADKKGITLRKLGGRLFIPIESVESIVPIGRSMVSRSRRIYYSGGLFGYTGRLKNLLLGIFTIYSTEKEPLILVSAKSRNYVFGCRNPYGFIGFVCENFYGQKE